MAAKKKSVKQAAAKRASAKGSGTKKKAAGTGTRAKAASTRKKVSKQAGGKAEAAARNLQRVFAMPFASVYPHYVTKVEKKGRTRAELDQVLRWLTGYTPRALQQQIERENDFETFFDRAPALNPKRKRITGTVCGVRVEEVEHPLMREIRYMDKLVDELAKGRPMEKVLRE